MKVQGQRSTRSAGLGRRGWYDTGLIVLLGLVTLSSLVPENALAQAVAPPANPPAATNPNPGRTAPNPFVRRIPVPEFPKDMQWLNTGGPIRMRDLRGKFVLLDFWTYCCINCIHILPELKKLERAYPNELVVIGVHSAKFETEKGSKNIEEAILRYEIEHPVVNDNQHELWNRFGVRSWPTAILIDPEGNAIWGTSGEFLFEDVNQVLQVGLTYYRQQGKLDPTPIRIQLLADQPRERTPLRFPGKVLADEASERLFISDSNHNRIVIAGFDGQLREVIGSGMIGRQDGDFQNASFDHPQGVALWGDTLYVADTENHLLRKVDLVRKQVSTIAGVGLQGRNPWPGADPTGAPPPGGWKGRPLETPINSPWDLLVRGDFLYIAMAGPHQIWRMKLDESTIGPYAGNGREDIVDGPLLPRQPYALGASSFAQPSGLAADDKWLYVADSEGSSVRAVPFDPKDEVKTVVGTSKLASARLFTFGDRDGEKRQVLLQHVLGVTVHEGRLFIADTYNNKIKEINPKTGATRTLAGAKEPGHTDDPPQFDEPAGISYGQGKLWIADTNNHHIRSYDLETGKVATLEIVGLQAPPEAKPTKPDFSDAKQVQLSAAPLQAIDGHITLQVVLELPAGWKLNPLAKPQYWLESLQPNGPVQRTALGNGQLEEKEGLLTLKIPVSGTGQEPLRLSLAYFICQEGGEGLCRAGSVVWTIPLDIQPTGNRELLLTHQIESLSP
jgi:thiol-disulfide isomerase/thioredoxin/DNA-binding beta-propeller fold protein YncE